MKNLYVRSASEYSKKEKVLLYLLAALIIAFLIGGSLWKDQEYNRTVLEGKKLKVKIRSVYCTYGKGQSGLFFLDKNNKVNKVIVNHDCYKYKKGDTVNVIYNEKQDWYYISNQSIP